MSERPYSFSQAIEAARRAAAAQAAVEDSLRESARDFARAEEAYRIALAQEIVRQHADEGVAWTVAPDLARGDKNVAKLRRERDIAEGVREAMQQQAWRRAADRKDTQRFCDWSQRREFAEAYGQEPEPALEPPIGSVRS